MSQQPTHELDASLTASERELLREIVHALRSIRYGSIELTVHDGQLVEVNKTERIRKGAARQTR